MNENLSHSSENDQGRKRQKFYARSWEDQDDYADSPYLHGSPAREMPGLFEEQMGDFYDFETSKNSQMLYGEPANAADYQQLDAGNYESLNYHSDESAGLEVFRSPANHGVPNITASVERETREVLGKPGQPLEKTDREFFESKMGSDFSNVRIHTDSTAAESAQSLNAEAYTHGDQVVFNQGKFAPDTPEGKHLLAHELTHVIQQKESDPVIQRQPIGPDSDSDFYETDPGFKGRIQPGSTVVVKSGGTLWDLSQAFGRLGLDISANDLQDYFGVEDATKLKAGAELQLPLVDKATGFLLLQSDQENPDLLNSVGRYFNYKFSKSDTGGIHISRFYPGYISKHDSFERLTFIAAALPAFRNYLVNQPFSSKYNRNPLTGMADGQREQRRRLRELFGGQAVGDFELGGAGGFLLGGAHGAFSALFGLLTLTDNAKVNEMYSEREAVAIQKSIEEALEGKSDAAITGALMQYPLGSVFGQLLTVLLLSRVRFSSGPSTAVWKYIEITQPFYAGTAIPKSFVIRVPVERILRPFQRIWVHPTATKHMAENILRVREGLTIEAGLIDSFRYMRSQMILTDFHASLQIALRRGLKYDEIINVGVWEFKFSAPRQKGLDPVLFHANYITRR
jgi:LysM repeat protein